jgi:hypothetical protein
MKHIILIITICLFPLLTNAQASGGQVKRSTKTVSKTGKKTTKSHKQRRKRETGTTYNYSPEINTLADITVTSYKNNGKDLTSQAVSLGQEIILFTVDNKLYMSNYCNSFDTQSFGPVTIITSREEPETQTTYGSWCLTGVWDYENDYDDKSGRADINIQIVEKQTYNEYIISINADEQLEYRGTDSKSLRNSIE